MITLITYDITCPKRLHKMHKFLLEYGANTQKSVFECDITDKDIVKIRSYAASLLDLKRDSLRIYRICSSCIDKTILFGKAWKVYNAEYHIF